MPVQEPKVSLALHPDEKVITITLDPWYTDGNVLAAIFDGLAAKMRMTVALMTISKLREVKPAQIPPEVLKRLEEAKGGANKSPVTLLPSGIGIRKRSSSAKENGSSSSASSS